MPCLPHSVSSLFLLSLAVLCASPSLWGQNSLAPVVDDPLIPLPELADPLNPGTASGQRRIRPAVSEGAVGAEVVDEVPSSRIPHVPVRDPQAVGAEVVDEPFTNHVIPSSGPVEREMTQVSVLGYHDFSLNKPKTRMRMSPADFRAEMQKIKNSGATVITLEDFIAWKKGDKKLPARCVLITLDDGWKSVYTDAYPIMKEFGYPFTLFLYTDYINKGGSSMTWDMIKEMAKNGASIGSHSKTHPYPRDFRKQKAAGSTAYMAYLTQQMAESKKILEENLGVKVTSYCYPGGYRTQEMYDVLAREGYLFGFDVIPGKVSLPTNDLVIPRYMVIGTELFTFDGALKYGTAGGQRAAGPAAAAFAEVSSAQAGPVPSQVVTPRANSLQPLNCDSISINMATVETFDPNSITMRVSGMGRVSGFYDTQTKTYSWKPNRPLRGQVHVSVTWTPPQSKTPSAPVEWSFKVTEFAEEAPPAGWIP